MNTPGRIGRDFADSLHTKKGLTVNGPSRRLFIGDEQGNVKQLELVKVEWGMDQPVAVILSRKWLVLNKSFP